MKALQVSLMLLVSTVAFAQLPDAPKPKFFDRETVLELSLSGSALAADAYFTNSRNTASLLETNPILGKFPSTTKGVGYFSAVFAGELGSMYIFRGHKWIKRGIPLAVTAVEAVYIARNMSVRGSAPAGCFNQVGSVLTPGVCVPGR